MIVLTMLFIYLTLGEGVLGKWLYNRLKTDMQINKNARVSFYIRTMSLLWGLTIIMLITSYSINIPFEEYGLKPPSANYTVSKYFKNMNISLWIGVCIGLIVPLIILKKSKLFQRYTERQMSDASEMLPNNYRETILWIFICITAGVTEELLFRSFMMNYLSKLFPALSIIGVLVISSIIFGLAHFLSRMERCSRDNDFRFYVRKGICCNWINLSIYNYTYAYRFACTCPLIYIERKSNITEGLK